MAIEDESTAEGVVLGGVLPDSVVQVLQAIRGSLMYFIASIGVLCLLLGAIGPMTPGLGSYVQGAMAGFLGIWGVSALLFAGIGYLFMRLIGYS